MCVVIKLVSFYEHSYKLPFHIVQDKKEYKNYGLKAMTCLTIIDHHIFNSSFKILCVATKAWVIGQCHKKSLTKRA